MKAKAIKATMAAILAVVLLTFSFTGCTHTEARAAVGTDHTAGKIYTVKRGL